MEQYFKRKSDSSDKIDDLNLPLDPAKRKSIMDYHPNQRDEVRRKYLIRGPCQPRDHNYKKRLIGNKLRRFNVDWFDDYGSWLEYSESEEKAYCLCCYLFRDDGHPGFVREGFSSWNKPDRLALHVGEPNSSHNNAAKKCDDLLNQAQSIIHALYKKDNVVKNEYRIRLNASIDVSRYLLQQGLAFRGHREGEESSNRGIFLELLKYTADHNDVIDKVVMKNAPGNNQMVSHEIQKDIVNSFAEEVVKSIIEEIDHGVFSLLVDELADVADKEQMAVIFRFVDKSGAVKERFVGVVHVKETSSLSLKNAIDELFAKYGLSLNKVRGQGYDGASNMKRKFNGLRSLISRENSSAYYVHCFAHQLQLVVVGVAKRHISVGDFFDKISTFLNVVGASCKRKDMVREHYWKEIEDGIASGEISTRKGKNQEISFQRPGHTRWGSHYKTLLRLVGLFSPIVKVLEHVENEGIEDVKRRQAHGLLSYIHTFDCVFYLHLMLLILGLTENLSMALQKKDQDILNAMSLVESTKRELQKVRDDGWDSLMLEVSSFCKKHDAHMLIMEEDFIFSRRERNKGKITNLHHYKVSCFNTVLDFQFRELNDRFTEVNTELLVCMASLSPVDAFRGFDKSKLLKLAKFYPDDFNFVECLSLEQQLRIYIDNV